MILNLFKPKPTTPAPVTPAPVLPVKPLVLAPEPLNPAGGYGSRVLQKGDQGPDVEELQIRLAGFAGGVPDGDFGPGTFNQVTQFQRDFMKRTPSGVCDEDTFVAIDQFADMFPFDFNPLKCPCGMCKGFGSGKYKDQYIQGQPKVEAYYMYEYPGIHRVILWAARAVFYYHHDLPFFFSCGYRCSINNQQKGRTSTNHCGKAVDMDVPLDAGEDKRDDMNRCNQIREDIVETANAQIAWAASNKKSLEPADIAPTWVHYDVRQFEKKYLEDRFFCTDLASLNNRLPIKI